jgi:hypothetical protein
MSYSERLLEHGSFLTRLAHNGRYKRALDLVADLKGGHTQPDATVTGNKGFDFRELERELRSRMEIERTMYSPLPLTGPRADEVEALDVRLTELARSGAPLRRALARIAGAFVGRRAWEPLGFARLGDYARERPGLSARELYDLAHVDGALAKLPAIGAAFASGELGWTKARLLCRVATPEDAGLSELPEGVQIGAEHMPPEADHIPPETDVWVANVPVDVGRLFRACLASVARRLNTGPGVALEAMFDYCIETWRCPTPREHRVFARDGWRCTVPGCTSQRNLHAHHVLFRSAGGGDELPNLAAAPLQRDGRAPD